MNRETWTGILGAVVLVGAMVAVFQYERTVGAERAGIVSDALELGMLDGPTADGRTTLGQSSEATLAIAQTDLDAVTLTLTWTAGQGADTLRLEVAPPEGVAAPEAVSGDSGTLTVTVPVENARPARAGAATLGTGDWTVRVTFESNTPVTPAPLPPVGGDGDVAWRVASALSAWLPAEA